ncbi:TetR/AcrR family transcriptional regulator [Microbacterium sp.]|uniref:TetR/AcrR family transcriptional regulator n=1 Tax=Microbacterium sp. TaxID=51671 RepID=UPI003C715DEF
MTSSDSLDEIAGSGLSARERLLAAATALFYNDGIHSVGVDRIITVAGVTRATMYKQFGGKEELVLAYLEGEDAGIRALFDDAAASAAASGAAPEELLELVIGGIQQDIAHRHTRGCPFINAAAEYPDAGPVRDLIARHREWFRETLRALADAAGLRDPGEVAGALVLLRDAALVGGYLDGRDRVAPVFGDTARAVIAGHVDRERSTA